MSIKSSARVLPILLGASAIATHRKSAEAANGMDPFSCADPVCKSKMDMLSEAMKTQNFKSRTGGVISEKEEERALECPVDKDELGKQSWTLLHTMAAYFPEKPRAEQSVYAEIYFKSLAALYPCKMCAEHMRNCITENPPDATSREALCLWVCEFHNQVNEVVGKPRFPCNIKSLDERWRHGKKECWGGDEQL